MKQKLPLSNYLPMPAVLAGANVAGKPNYMTVAWVGVMDFEYLSIAIHRVRYTYAGIIENGSFSVNLPSASLLPETDYCGLVSGKNIDKSALFENFYGELGTAPMIAQCPVNIECKLVQTVDSLPTHAVFIGEMVAVYADDGCITNGKLDYEKVQPFLYLQNEPAYRLLGSRCGTLGKPGREFEQKNKLAR